MSKFAQMETQAERNQDGSGAQELSDDDDNEEDDKKKPSLHIASETAVSGGPDRKLKKVKKH